MWRVFVGIVVVAAGGVGSGSEYSGAGAGGRLPGAPSSVGGTYAGGILLMFPLFLGLIP